MSISPIDSLIDQLDLAGLRSHLAQLSSDLAWRELAAAAQHLASAASTRPSLGPMASTAAHLLARAADAAHAVTALDLAVAPAFGPLTEVIASSHQWSELAPHLDDRAHRSVIAYERVLRDENLEGDSSIDTSLFDLPLVLQEWEPDAYPTAHYRDDGGEFPMPKRSTGAPVDLPAESELLTDLTATAALTELFRPWVEDSNGACDAVAVSGDVMDAIAAMGWNRARISAIAPTEALSLLGWAGASGGAHGPRRGAATGRFSAWWTIAALGGVADDWPVEPEEIGELTEELRWYVWETDLGPPDDEPPTWRFQLAAADPGHRIAWAVSAHDHEVSAGS